MGKYNLHTHTYRCNHAEGDIPDLIKAAGENGYTTLGFSEHSALNDGVWPNTRMKPDEFSGYFSKINEYRLIESEKPGGIKIYSGLECEAPEKYFNFYKELKDKYKIDYLLAGVHFFYYKNEIITAFSDRYENQQKIKTYADHMIKCMESGLFLYIVHPDMFMLSKERWDHFTEDVMKNVMRASKEYKIPLELNLNGYRKGLMRKGLNLRYPYPFEEFWALAASENVEAVTGIDAHNPRNFAPKYPEFDRLCEKYSLNILSEKEIAERVEKS